MKEMNCVSVQLWDRFKAIPQVLVALLPFTNSRVKLISAV